MSLLKTSEEKLSQVYNALIAKGYTETAKKITEVILAETNYNTRGKKFNIYDCTSTDEIRYVMNGVYHDNGYKVASNGYVLCAVKQEYAPELEGKIVTKSGEFIEGRYPKWRSVICGEDICKRDGTLATLSSEQIQTFRNRIKELRAESKAKYVKGMRWYDGWRVKLGAGYYKAELFELFCKAAEMFKFDKCYTFAIKGLQVMADNVTFLMMPMLAPEERDEKDPDFAVIEL